MSDITTRSVLDTGCLPPMFYRGHTHTVALSMEMPWPPSKNTYWRAWRNRIIVSRLGNAFKKAAVARIRETLTLSSLGHFGLADGRIVRTDDGLVRIAEGLRVGIRLSVHAPNRAKRDISNYIVATQDAVESAGVIVDDEVVDYCEIVRHSVSPRDGYARVDIAILSDRIVDGKCLCRAAPVGLD